LSYVNGDPKIKSNLCETEIAGSTLNIEMSTWLSQKPGQKTILQEKEKPTFCFTVMERQKSFHYVGKLWRLKERYDMAF
jgi:hypothetical protein